MNAKKLRGEYVLVEPITKDEVTASGIKIAKKEEQGDFLVGIVKMVGTGKVVFSTNKDIPSAHFLTLDISVGDKVIFQYGMKIQVEGESFLLVNEADIKIIL